jgi:isopentenyl diphosphate isomerase/L-lactate dehydrogenase-like FMN-dependent dehydrogenase
MLRLLRDELEAAMALTGCRTLADAGPARWAP